MTVLVTGSSGFIGSYLVAALQKRGETVVGVDRRPPTWSSPDGFVRGDLRDAEVRARALAGVHRVYHLAAAKDDWGLSESEYFQDNVEVTRDMVEQGVRGGTREWVFFSTVAVLGPGAEARDELAAHAPTTPYGASKAAAEDLFQTWVRSDPRIAVAIIRPSAVYGPENPPSTNVFRLIESLRSRKFIMVGSGATRKTTSYIGNVIAAALHANDRLRVGIQVYNCVDQPVWTTGELVKEICELLRRDRPTWSVPLGPARAVARVFDLAGGVLRIDFPITSARINKFCAPTNYSPEQLRRTGFTQPVDNHNALKLTVDWHVEPRKERAQLHREAVLLASSTPITGVERGMYTSSARQSRQRD